MRKGKEIRVSGERERIHRMRKMEKDIVTLKGKGIYRGSRENKKDTGSGNEGYRVSGEKERLQGHKKEHVL